MTEKAIISIDVDDEKFRKFKTLFDQYTSKLGDMPDEWKRIQKALDSATKSLSGAFSTQHEKGFVEGAKQMRMLAEHFTGVTKSSRVFNYELSRSRTILRAIAKEGGTFFANVTSGAGALARLAEGIGGAIGGALGGVGFAAAAGTLGLEKLGSLALGQRQARRLVGSSIGEISAFKTAYGNKVFSSPEEAKGFAERVAVARRRPEAASAFAELGISMQQMQSMPGIKLAELVAKRSAEFSKKYSPFALSAIAEKTGVANLLPGGLTTLYQFRNANMANFDKAASATAAQEESFRVSREQAARLTAAKQAIESAGKTVTHGVERGVSDILPGSRAYKQTGNSLTQAGEALRQAIKNGKDLTAQGARVRNLVIRAVNVAIHPSTLFGRNDNGRVIPIAPGNNFGNLKDPKTGKFQSYATPQEGARALAAQLSLDVAKHHQNTLQQLVYGNKFHAGYTATQRAEHLRIMEQVTGLKANQQIPLNRGMLAKLMSATALAEGYGHISPAEMSALAGIPANRGSSQPQVSLRVQNSTAARVAVTGAIVSGMP